MIGPPAYVHLVKREGPVTDRDLWMKAPGAHSVMTSSPSARRVAPVTRMVSTP